MIRLYNTATRTLEKFSSISPDRVSIYSCGPTVYDRQHIGNLRKALFDDLLKRVLRMHGYMIYSVTNITDVGHLVHDDRDEGEDKMEKSARHQGRNAYDIARGYEDLWQQDLDKLNVVPSNHYPRATEYIQEQINLIKRLEKKGFTYITEDGVYFDTSRFPQYADFARLDVKNLETGVRVAQKAKRNSTDFALWKFSPPQGKRQMEWESPWGIGFPGWHSECVVMSDSLLHAPFDIHTGGKDHIPIHHTNEIAQFSADTGKPLANYWIHSYFLTVNQNKMSKSAGTFLTLDDLESEGYHPLDFRLLILMAHYRSDIDFSWESMTQAHQSRKRLVEFGARISNLPHRKNKPLEHNLKKILTQFRQALYLDLDSPKALAIVFNYIREINTKIDQGEPMPRRHIMKLLQKFDRILALDLLPTPYKIPSQITELMIKRESARKTKDYAEADRLRDQILKAGYEVKDTSDGPQILRLRS